MLLLSPLDLHTGQGAALLQRIRLHISPNLAVVANQFARAFTIGSPWAPGFCCIGAELTLDHEAAAAYGMPRLSVAGNADTPDAALASCLGEAADRLAVVERGGDISTAPSQPDDALAGSWMSEAIRRAARPPEWIDAQEAISGRVVALPADYCLRRQPERRVLESPGALSAGVAAGPDFESAALRAGLELCERDAAALWWLGGRLPRAFPLEHPASMTGSRFIQLLRQGRSDRQTMLLDITTDLDIPVVAAVSLDRDGLNLACGFAARLGWSEAARSAVLEMCQMELAAPLAAAKRAERGEGGLNDIDRRHLQRAAYQASNCTLIHPRGLSPVVDDEVVAGNLGELAQRLTLRGVRSFVIELTRTEIGVAVARFVSPDLQPYTPDVLTDRLRKCREAGSGLHEATASIPLV